jgi:hypothetical protein
VVLELEVVLDLVRVHKGRVVRVVYWAMQVAQEVGPVIVVGPEVVAAVVVLL